MRRTNRQLHALSQRLIKAQEEERLHLSRELHDEFGQLLAALMVQLGLLERDADHPEIVRDRLRALKQATCQIQNQLCADGEVVSVASSECAYETPRPMWTEQHPHLWWAATVDSIRRVLAESGVNPADIGGIGLTGQMHGLVLLNEKGEVLRPAILWNDQRTAAECDEIRARLGVVALTLGTSGVVFASTQEPFIEPQGRLHAFCHAVPGRWHLMGVMLSAGGSLRWYRDTVAPGTDFDALLRPAGEVPPGCEGLLFLPYLTGERTPHPDPLARGAFVGLTVRHTLAYMTRAVLEGVAFSLPQHFPLSPEKGQSCGRIVPC